MLLNDPLIKKYFGCNCDGAHEYSSPDPEHNDWWCKKLMAFNVIEAMEQPIKKGERYLRLAYDSGWDIVIYENIHEGELMGFGNMRLPDRFQTPAVKECGKCDVCGYDYQRYCREHTSPAPSPAPTKDHPTMSHLPSDCTPECRYWKPTPETKCECKRECCKGDPAHYCPPEHNPPSPDKVAESFKNQICLEYEIPLGILESLIALIGRDVDYVLWRLDRYRDKRRTLPRSG